MIEFDFVLNLSTPAPAKAIAFVPRSIQKMGHYHLLRDATPAAKICVERVNKMRRSGKMSDYMFGVAPKGVLVQAMFRGKMVVLDIEAFAVTGGGDEMVIVNAIYDIHHGSLFSVPYQRPQVARWELLDVERDRIRSLFASFANSTDLTACADQYNQVMCNQRDWIYYLIPLREKREWG